MASIECRVHLKEAISRTGTASRAESVLREGSALRTEPCIRIAKNDNNALLENAPHEIDFKVRYDDLCWAISRARKHHIIGHYITYLRYVRYQSNYAKAAEVALLQYHYRYQELHLSREHNQQNEQDQQTSGDVDSETKLPITLLL